MKESTIKALLRAYSQLQVAAAELYTEAQKASERFDYDDASLLEARADMLFEQADSILLILAEQENG